MASGTQLGKILIDKTIQNELTTGGTYSYDVNIPSQDAFVVISLDIGPSNTLTSLTFNGVAMTSALNFTTSNGIYQVSVIKNPPVGNYPLRIVISGTEGCGFLIFSLLGVDKTVNSYLSARATGSSGVPNLNLPNVVPGSFIIDWLGSAQDPGVPNAEQYRLFYDNVSDTASSYKFGSGNTIVGWQNSSSDFDYYAIAFPPAKSASVWNPNVTLRNSIDVLETNGLDTFNFLNSPPNTLRVFGSNTTQFYQNSFLHTIGREGLSPVIYPTAGPLSNALMAYWAFDEFGSEYAIKDDLNQFPGFWIGAASNPYISNGKINSAANLTGTNTALFPASPMLNGVTIPAISVSLWINQGDVITQNQYYFYVNSGGTTVAIKISTAGNGFRVNFDTPGGAISNFNSSTSTVQGVWYHVVLIYDGSNVWLYVNGKLDTGPNAVAGTLLLTNTTFYIGSGGGLNFAQNAYVDEVGVWLRALTPDEVVELYNDGQGLAYPFLPNSNVVAVGNQGYNPYSQGQRYFWQTSFLQTIGKNINSIKTVSKANFFSFFS